MTEFSKCDLRTMCEKKWEELAETFAIGLHNTILHWSPDRVVLGGSMFNEIGISVERHGGKLTGFGREDQDFDDVARGFLPDLDRRNGSYDLVLGGSLGLLRPFKGVMVALAFLHRRHTFDRSA